MGTGLEHREHATRDGETPGGVAGSEQDGDEADSLLLDRAGVQQGEHPAHDDDAVHEIRTRHQGRVQNGRHTPDDHPAGEGREHEDVQGDKPGHGYVEIHRWDPIFLKPLWRMMWRLWPACHR